MNAMLIDENSPLANMVLATLVVFNQGGECSIQWAPGMREKMNNMPEGHYMLDLPQSTKADDFLASISVKNEQARLFLEHLATGLDVGTHQLVAKSFLSVTPTLNMKSSIKC